MVSDITNRRKLGISVFIVACVAFAAACVVTRSVSRLQSGGVDGGEFRTCFEDPMAATVLENARKQSLGTRFAKRSSGRGTERREVRDTLQAEDVA